MSNPTVLLETTSGDILIELFPTRLPTPSPTSCNMWMTAFMPTPFSIA